MNVPKNQHWVPQFYLRGFAIPGKEKVWIFSRRHGDDLETKAVNIRNVAAEKFLYSPLQKDGTRSFEAEVMMGEVEDVIGRFWHRFAEGVVNLDANQGMRRGLAWFMALLLARHPDQFEKGAQIHDQMLRLYQSAPKDEAGRPKITGIEIGGEMRELDNSDWESYRDAREPEIRQSVVESIRSLTIALTEDIFKKKWTIVASQHPVFVTSDRPVYLMHDKREHFGTRTQGTRVVFPISPTRILLAHDHEATETNKYVHLRGGDALPWNFLTWVHAKRFLISHIEPTPLIEAMVLESDKYERVQANMNRARRVKVGRNQQCPCGSERKFKDCCGRP